MHGHQFQVLKIGWPKYRKDGKYKGENYDVACDISRVCDKASWANSTWDGGNVPGLIKSRAPRKDTVLVPLGGYVVMRVKIDNPGK